MSPELLASLDGRAAARPPQRLFSILDLRAFLGGAWELNRRLWDRRQGERGSFEGEARFEADGEGLAYRESGRLRLGGHAGPAQRALLFAFPLPGLAQVRFPDGRLFHALDLSRGPFEAEYPCGADRYRGRFHAAGTDAWRATWRVRGPGKDQIIESFYARRLAPAGSFRATTAVGTGEIPQPP